MATDCMNSVNLADLPGEVTAALTHYGITAAELARRTGVPQPVIWKLVKGKQQHVRSDVLSRLLPFLTRSAPKEYAPAAPEGAPEASAGACA